MDNIEKILKKIIRKLSIFDDLDQADKKEILKYINDHKLGIRLFEKRWYDALSNSFFVNEYCYDDSLYGYFLSQKEFKSFSKFYEYLNGDIYRNSAYFGYDFTNEEIRRYKINKAKIEQSFEEETVDDDFIGWGTEINKDCYEVVKASRDNFIKWCNENKTVKDYQDLKNKLKESKRFGCGALAQKYYVNLLMETEDQVTKQAVIDYFCMVWANDITFGDIYIHYGDKVAVEAIDGFDRGWSDTTKRVFKGNMRSILGDFRCGAIFIKKSIRYDEDAALYVVKNHFYSAYGVLGHRAFYFTTFDELKSFLRNDISGAFLLYAPIVDEDVKDCVIDENTILPTSRTSHDVKKIYLNHKFYVKETWRAQNGLVLHEKEKEFDNVCDFLCYLDGDLSNADLASYPGIKNCKPNNFLNMHGVKLSIKPNHDIGCQIRKIDYEDSYNSNAIAFVESNETSTQTSFLTTTNEIYDGGDSLSYISDIHLLHRYKANNCVCDVDAYALNRRMADKIAEECKGFLFVAGDVSSDFNYYCDFMDVLSDRLHKIAFITLGNHELWPFEGENMDSIVKKYREIISDSGYRLVHNNLYLVNEWEAFKEKHRNIVEITTKELILMHPQELRKRAKRANFIIFGGIGFSGFNDSFNADSGMYRNTITREQEIEESKLFYDLYLKVYEALYDKNVIVLTHMPLEDWNPTKQYNKKFIYINGHNHKNTFCDDGEKRLFADNQIGYHGKEIQLKSASFETDYDWFSDRPDGIHEISLYDYADFYRGLNQNVWIYSEFEKMYMLKNSGIYMFIVTCKDGRMKILDGGSTKFIYGHDIQYYYDRLPNYAKSVKMYLSKYETAQKEISSQVRSIGGSGRIHGCIIDIDFWNHIYLNPLDGKATCYFAESMTSKHVYENIKSLLKYKCPALFDNYTKKMLEGNASVQQSNAIALMKNENDNPKSIFVEDTSIYSMSRKFRKLQYTTQENVVRLWNDFVVDESSEENGRLIVGGLLDSEEAKRQSSLVKVPRYRKPSAPKKPREKADAQTLEQRYIDKLSKITNTIEVIKYTGACDKTSYRCKLCGHEWQTRSDKLKDIMHYKCPNCKK